MGTGKTLFNESGLTDWRYIAPDELMRAALVKVACAQ